MTMKKIVIFVPVQTMKIFFIFVVSSGHAKPHAQLQIARHLELDYENFLTNVNRATTLMNYNYQAGQFIGFWIARLQNTRYATEPLPDANFET